MSEALAAVCPCCQVETEKKPFLSCGGLGHHVSDNWFIVDASSSVSCQTNGCICNCYVATGLYQPSPLPCL